MYESSQVNCTSFFSSYCTSPREKFLKKKLFHEWKLTQIYFKKHQFCSYNICMSHQRSIVHHFFPLNVQVLEKNFLRKSCSISENWHKCTSKNINFAHITYVWVIKGQLYIIFFLLMYKPWRKISWGKVVPLVKTNTNIL